MNIGKLVKRNGEFFIRDLTSEELHHVTAAYSLTLGEFYSFEINEDDDAVDLVPISDALIEWGIQPSTGSFYTALSNTENGEPEDTESQFGTCELTGMRGDIVPCLYLNDRGDVVEVNFGSWLVHSILGKLAGAF